MTHWAPCTARFSSLLEVPTLTSLKTQPLLPHASDYTKMEALMVYHPLMGQGDRALPGTGPAGLVRLLPAASSSHLS